MPRFTLQTDVAARATIPASLRCAWSAAIAAMGTEVWIRVEAAHVADGAPVTVEVFRTDEKGALAEKLDGLTGTIDGGAFESRHRISIPSDRLAAVPGRFTLVLVAAIEAYHVRAESAPLALHRPRFSI